ncbi:hypothetical protein [Psychrobacillus sp.]|uniref:hypothetical protein n=1 Tax=Psychrobacillus sp. TaxID=1871623 RepID=UPI0028BE8E41|nr:hypothetical protein [Psychrobacillus sp.]
MLNVKVKANAVRLSIPVPYLVLNIGITILSSRVLNKMINKWIIAGTKEKDMSFTIPQLNKMELKEIVKELKRHRGLHIVDVKAKDGTEVLIRL